MTDASKLALTFQKTSDDNVAMSLGVVFAKDINTENNTYTVTEIPWTTPLPPPTAGSPPRRTCPLTPASPLP
ncbi:MAG: hypothetical protein ACLSHU_07220 [Oscillospiraceae bacterium]